MSQPDARSFVERIAEDEALRRELTGALNGNAEKAAEEIVALGNLRGLSFTAAEIGEAVAEWQKNLPRELSDSALEAVSGGTDVLFRMADFTVQYATQMETRKYSSISNAAKMRSEITNNSIDNIK